MLAVNYQGLVPVLINALKEQQSEIEILKQQQAEIDELKEMVNQLTADK
jgi:type II secretory pathway component PulM